MKTDELTFYEMMEHGPKVVQRQIEVLGKMIKDTTAKWMESDPIPMIKREATVLGLRFGQKDDVTIEAAIIIYALISAGCQLHTIAKEDDEEMITFVRSYLRRWRATQTRKGRS